VTTVPARLGVAEAREVGSGRRHGTGHES